MKASRKIKEPVRGLNLAGNAVVLQVDSALCNSAKKGYAAESLTNYQSGATIPFLMVKSKLSRQKAVPGNPAGAVEKVDDESSRTPAGSTIKVEAWVDTNNKVVKYNLAYINHSQAGDLHGRVLGYDNAHLYPNFSTFHHRHWQGYVTENLAFTSYEDQLDIFHQELLALKVKLGAQY